MHDVNQQTLATRLGLSRATVSRCFTNHRAINPSTRARVFELAAKLGYQYLEVRTTADGHEQQSATVGVLICYAGTFTPGDRFENPGQKLLDGVSEHAQLREVQLDVHYVDPTELSIEGPSYKRIASLQRHEWGGALLIYSFPEPIIDALLPRFPCVSLVEQYGRGDVNCVDVDHYRGISKMMDLVVNLGHRRIGFFSSHPTYEAYWAKHRFAAYFEKLLTLGMEYEPKDVINVLPNEVITEKEALEQMLARTNDGVTTWVCPADYSAYSAITYLTANGLKVPEQISVTGFDGIKPPAKMPAATTLEIPFREIGITGTRRLLNLIKSPFTSPQHILLGCQVRLGKTVGPAPGLAAQKRRGRRSNHNGKKRLHEIAGND